MNIQKEIIKILEKPINSRSFKMKSYKEIKHTPPYFVLFRSSAVRIAQEIKRVCNDRDEEIAAQLQNEDAEKLIKKFGKYPPKERKFVVEGFLLARSYILNNKMRL